MNRGLAILYIFVFSLATVVCAKNPDFVRKLQREQAAAKTIEQKRAAAAKIRAAQRLQNKKKLESQKIAESQMNSAEIQTELKEIVGLMPTEAGLIRAIQLRNKLRFFSPELEEFIIQCYWYTGYEKEAEKAARIYLQSHESPIIHKVLLESSLKKKSEKLAEFHLERAKLEFMESVPYRFQILKSRFKRLFKGPAALVVFTVFLLVFLWMFFKLFNKLVLVSVFSLIEKMKNIKDKNPDSGNAGIKNYARLEPDEKSDD